MLPAIFMPLLYYIFKSIIVLINIKILK